MAVSAAAAVSFVATVSLGAATSSAAVVPSIMVVVAVVVVSALEPVEVFGDKMEASEGVFGGVDWRISAGDRGCLGRSRGGVVLGSLWGRHSYIGKLTQCPRIR